MGNRKKSKKTYSEKVKDLLEEYGNVNCKEIILDVRRELHISLSHVSDIKIRPVYYKPEVYFVRKKDRRLITFQVFDTQSKKEDKGDVFSAFFTTNIAVAYFIVRDNKRLDDINHLISIIESKLIRDFKADRKMFPTCTAITIDEDKLSNKILIFDILDKLSKKYKW